MADKDLGGIKFTVDGDDSGLKRVDESMEGLQKTAKDTQQGLDNLGGEATKSSKQVKNFGDAAEKTEKKTKGMSTAVKAAGAALATYLTIDAAKEIIKTADSFELLNDRIRLATDSTGDYVSVQRELYQLSQQTGTALSGNVDLFQRIQIGASELGRSNTDVIQLVESLSKLGTLGGSSSEELNNATVQLSQGLAGGIIRAEEFNSILENTPKIAQAIATGLNVSVGELRNMMLNGELLANDVFDSILSQTTQINEQFDQMPNRIGRAGTSLSNAWSNTVGLLNDATGASSAIADWMDAIAEKLDQRVDYWREELDLVEQMEIQVSSLEAAYRGLGLVQLEARKATLSRMEADLAERVKEVEGNIISLPMDDVIRQNYAAVKAELDEVSKQIEKITGDQKDGANDVNEALEALLKKYPKLVDAEQLLLEEQLLLNAALETAADKEIPAIVSALEQVRLKLKQIRDERKGDGPLVPVVDSGGSSGMSIFDVGADTQTEFKNQIEGIAPELGKAIGYEIAEGTEKQLDKLDWSQYGGNIGASLGEALVTGDTSMLKGALSGAVGNITTDALTPALTSAFGAGASAFLGPLAGGVAGSLVDGIMSGKQEISRSIRLVVADGVAEGFTDVEYDSIFGGSSATFGMSDQQNAQINRSLQQVFGELDDQLESLGATVSDFAGEFEGDSISEAIKNAGNDYVDAGFEFIEDFQRVGESLTDAFERVSAMMIDVADGLDGIVGDSVSNAVQSFIDQQTILIDANTELGVEYWKAAQVAIADIAAGAIEPLEGISGDVDRASAEYKRAFDTYLDTVTDTGGQIQFNSVGRIRSGDFLVDWIEENQLAETISRLGEGVEKATADFATNFSDAVDGDVTGALESLTNVLADDADIYAENIKNLGDDLIDLGFDAAISTAEFSRQFEEATSDVITDETLARFANAAMLIEDISDNISDLASDALSDIKDKIADLIDADEDRLEGIEDSIKAQIELEENRSDAEIERLQNEQTALSESIANAKSLINLLDKAMNTLAERSEDLQAKLYAQSFSEIQAAIDTAKQTGELPDSQLVEGAVSQLATAGTGDFATRVDREREALQARKLLSDLNELSDDQLTTDEKQLKALDKMIEAEEINSTELIDSLNARLESAKDQHDELTDALNDNFDQLSSDYSDENAISLSQLDVLIDLRDSLSTLPNALSSIASAVGKVSAVNQDNSEVNIAEYLKQFTEDNWLTDEEGMQIYNTAREYGVSSSLVGDILNSQLTGGSMIDINEWLDRNNLPALTGNMNSMASAVSSMSDRLSSQLSEIAGSSSATANVLNSSSDPSGFGLRVSQV